MPAPAIRRNGLPVLGRPLLTLWNENEHGAHQILVVRAVSRAALLAASRAVRDGRHEADLVIV